MSVAIENFVKAIYKNKNNDSNDTKPGNIAKKLGISNAAATDMAKKLAAKDLLNYEKYKALELTDKGEKMALNVVRKHRLWEAFLYKTFDMSLHDIHREAELLEHETSSFLANKISEYLGNPKFDPHGDPIPAEDGTIVSRDTRPLIQIEPGETVRIAGVKQSDPDFLQYLDTVGLTLDTRIHVVACLAFDQSMQLQIGDNTLTISGKVVDNLLVLREEK